MTQEEQRIAIAEACGWNYIDSKTIYPRGIKDGVTLELPDYLNDLNAMHDAEKVLTQDQMIDYSRHVGKLVTSHLPASRAAWMDFKLINSTASQRAEAFLRTIGKWKECK
jgi:hypothetical protein